MKSLFARFLEGPMARPAMVAPALVMIIFSIFSLTAPSDPARTMSAVTVGLVNQDTGLPSPPIKISERMLQGFAGQMPVQMQPFADRAEAEAALAAGEVSLVLAFPPEFSQTAMQSDQAVFEIITSNHLTVAEVQVAGQLRHMLPAAMSAGVASIKLAMAQGKMPSLQMPVMAEVTSLTAPEMPAAMLAPFSMLYTTWLAALGGAVTMVVATRARVDRVPVAITRSVMPVVSIGFGALCLSLVVGATVNWGLVLPVWLVVWPTALAITWLFVGLVAVLGFWIVAILLPFVFYQSAVGGVMAPKAAAPEWLQSVTGWLPLDGIGASYRGAVHGIDMAYPLALITGFAIVGLGLIWVKSALPAKKAV